VPEEELLKLKRVIARSGQCKTRIYTDPTFPRPIKIGKRASVWIASEVDAWIRARIAESRKVRTQPVAANPPGTAA
jgi:prophage regulatory protein